VYLRWLDETPTARVIARCTQDIRAIDGPVPRMFGAVAEISNSIVTRVVVVVAFSPVFLFPGIFVCVLGLYLGNMYLKAQIPVKREMRYCVYRTSMSTAADRQTATHVLRY